jgi:hypothetical protein
MSSAEFLKISNDAEIVFCVVALCLLIFHGHWRRYWALGMFLLVRASSGILMSLLTQSSYLGANRQDAYRTYFYVYWTAYAVEAVLALLVIYAAFRLALTPLRGLQRFAGRVFGAIAIVCIAVTTLTAFSRPQLTGFESIIAAITQLQRTQSMLTLCLALSVLGVSRAVGLSYRSTVFGITLGLGNLAGLNILLNSPFALHPQNYWQYGVLNAATVIAAFGLWTVYLALPERDVQPVDLPANSLLARWNNACLAMIK